MENSVSLTGLTPTYMTVEKHTDGTQQLDLTATVVLMAKKLKEYETRIKSLETNLTALHATLATKTSTSHTHSSAG